MAERLTFRRLPARMGVNCVNCLLHYLTFSKLFPARKTMLECAILEKGTSSEDPSSDDDEKKGRGLVDVVNQIC